MAGDREGRGSRYWVVMGDRREGDRGFRYSGKEMGDAQVGG